MMMMMIIIITKMNYLYLPFESLIPLLPVQKEQINHVYLPKLFCDTLITAA